MEPALKEGQFFVKFQPIYQLVGDIDHAMPIAGEALLRWQHPQQGSISPKKFIPIFEKMALSAVLTDMPGNRPAIFSAAKGIGACLFILFPLIFPILIFMITPLWIIYCGCCGSMI